VIKSTRLVKTISALFGDSPESVSHPPKTWNNGPNRLYSNMLVKSRA